MVLRGCGECAVCALKFVMRTGVGLEQECSHSFDCPNCFTPITVKVRLGEPPAAGYEFVENCREANEDAPGLTIINLHPSIAFTADQYHSPMAFPSMVLTSLVGPAMRAPAASRRFDVSQDFELPETKSLWGVVKSVMALHSNGDPANVLQKQIARYTQMRQEYRKEFSCTTTFKCIASFFDDGMFPALGNLRQPLRAFVSGLRATHSQALADFESYYRANVERDNFER